jgi:hypothetical protein
MGYNGGLANWRLRSGRKLIDRILSEECLYRRPTANSGRWASPRSHRTALRSRQPLGSAEVTHPFHPLRGHRFVVLKVRRIAGVETLSLRHSDLGSFAMPREWTDWATPDAQVTPTGAQPLITDAFGLLALNELIASLTRKCGA